MSGDGAAQSSVSSHEVLNQVYAELRRLAASKMAHEPQGHTLQATALVHEAWLRMESQRDVCASRTAYFRAAAESMRRILIDRARAKRTAKRGGGAVLLDEEKLDSAAFEALQMRAPDDELLAVNDALERLSEKDPVSADLVKLRYFVGMTMAETAEALQLPVRSAERRWAFCRAWLRRALQDAP